MRVSLCMIVKDEEAALPRCLASVAGVVDEMVVVDTGSSDGTAAVAAAHGARIVRFAWEDHFARARNAGLAHATGDWILVLDADEELEPATRSRLRATIEASGADALRVIQRSFLPAGSVHRWEEVRSTRLFRNRPAHRYELPIHEQISPAIERAGGRIADADLVVLHHGYAQPAAQGASRAARNLRLLERALAGSPDDPFVHLQLGATRKALGDAAGARAALERALVLAPDRLGPADLEALHLKLSQLALDRGDHAGALAHARECLARGGANGIATLVAALASLHLGDVRGAHDLFRALAGRDDVDLGPLGGLDAVLAHCRRALGE